MNKTGFYRLLIVSSEFPPGPGGIGTHAHALARFFSEHGWEVKVITPQDYADDEMIKVFRAKQSFSIRRLKHIPGVPIEGLYRLLVLWNNIRQWRPHVIMATGERMVWLTAFLTRFFRIPWVAIGHGTEFEVTISWERALSRWAFSRADTLVCVSKYTRSRMEAMGIKPRKLFVVHNGADARRFRPADSNDHRMWLKSYGLEQAYIILTVGSVTERKGQDIVIRALPKILKKEPRVHYLIVGLPREKERLQKLARTIGVSDHVHFLGCLNNDELLRAYQSADVYVMVSRHSKDGDFEGYGISVLEAALCGVPAVVSGNSGLEEAVIDGHTGFVVPPEDPDATAEAILRFIRDPDLRNMMAENARRRAITECTWEVRGHRYREILESLVQTKSNE